MISELEREEIIADKVVWKKIREDTGRAINIKYVLDVSDELLADKEYKESLLHSMSIEQRQTIRDAYIKEESSVSIKIPEENFSGQRFFLLGAPGPLTENRIETLENIHSSIQKVNNTKRRNLRKHIQKRGPNI